MGFFGGGGNSGAQNNKVSASDELIDRQHKQNQADIQQKTRALSQQRLDILKSNGGQVWTPRR